ncbi:MAG TPA: UDP-N-acetylmuramoyl-L-alanine--D-glutamate ligase [Bryobacteraceae bacterium]|nr:UDP-N-acetylmuramoyl-L-alanine--D-glutamate ligase [Bryobacteraceae bacterium]
MAELQDRIRGATVAVVGMAKSGFAAAALLREHGATVRAVDSSNAPELFRQASAEGLEILPQQAAAFAGVDAVVISPGVPADLDLFEPLRAGGIPVIGELELAGWWLQGPVIGITGSNGKTTTTALVGEILRQAGIPSQVGGNIGRPPTDMVASSRPDQWTVLELSSFQLEMTDTFRAHVAVALNVTPNHLDRHHSFENYAAAKGRIFRNQQPGDTAILNADDHVCRAYASQTRASVVWFSLERPVEHGFWLDGDTVRADGGVLMKVTEVRLRGRHNLQNVMAAAATARRAGASFDQIRRAVQTFPGVEHRIEPVGQVNGVDYYNDSKATSVDAALKAVDSFPGGLWIILGGKDKGASYAPLGEPLRSKAHAALLIGAAAGKISNELAGFVPVIRCDTLETAVQYAHQHATRGDTVLLAPACASFDQFRSYEHRGQVFKQLVNELAAEDH